jgi:hypothetical protein
MPNQKSTTDMADVQLSQIKHFTEIPFLQKSCPISEIVKFLLSMELPSFFGRFWLTKETFNFSTGLYDWVKRQVKCPECRTEHHCSNPENFPTNLTLVRFMEVHIEAMGGDPADAMTGPPSLQRCGVSRIALFSSAMHVYAAPSLPNWLLTRRLYIAGLRWQRRAQAVWPLWS